MPLDKTDDMGDWIKDFQKSDAPQFKGKSQDKRRQMAIAAKLATENNALREANITIYEKRAFILAAKQAFLDGKKTFVFKEKEYKCTVREEQDLFGELTDYLIHKKEDVDTATMADVDDGADAPDDIEPEDLESARDHAAQRFKKFNSEESEVDENIKIKAFKNATDKTKKGLEISKTGGMGGTIMIKNKKELKDLETQLAKAKRQHKLAEGNAELDEGMKAKNIKAQTKVLQTLRKVGGKTKGHKMAMMDLLTMFAPKEVEKAYKANSRGFTNLMNMMYPRNKDSLTISDLTIDGKFMAKSGRFLTVDQTKQLGNPLDNVKESVEYHDRESMPSAVDDAANVMSKLDVYTNFIKKTY